MTKSERIEQLERCENEEEFQDMLNETNPDFFGWYPAFALKRLDPISYKNFWLNYNDSLIRDLS